MNPGRAALASSARPFSDGIPPAGNAFKLIDNTINPRINPKGL
jgi:hypothetical protein